MSSGTIILFLVSFFGSVSITAFARAYALHVNLLDMPNQRSSHDVATPRGGGIGIVVVFLGVVLTLWTLGEMERNDAVAFLLGGGLVAGIGFIDDHSDVSAKWRILVQIVAATLAVILLGGLPEFQVRHVIVDLGIPGDFLAVIFMVWFTNAFNFMDGIDGIAASETICIAGGAFLITQSADGGPAAILLGCLAMASVGFLVWNWPPARIFMGDVGSAFLGFVLIALAIYETGSDTASIWTWLILGGVFIVDPTVTLITRMLRREKWLSAHRDHAYQKITRRVGSHRRVTIGVIATNVIWLFPVAYVAQSMPENGWWLTGIAWGPLLGLSLWVGAGQPEQASAESFDHDGD